MQNYSNQLQIHQQPQFKKTEKKTLNDKTEPNTGGKTLSCWNCSKEHRINDCPEVCKIHKKKCKNIYKCLKIEQAEKEIIKLKKDTSEEINSCVNPNGIYVQI